jgi:hypothetical protein
LTDGYFLNSMDAKRTVDGIEMKPEDEQIYILLFGRTLFLSVMITRVLPAAWLSDRVPAGAVATSLIQHADDSGTASLLDEPFGANVRLESASSAARGDQ